MEDGNRASSEVEEDHIRTFVSGIFNKIFESFDRSGNHQERCNDLALKRVQHLTSGARTETTIPTLAGTTYDISYLLEQIEELTGKTYELERAFEAIDILYETISNISNAVTLAENRIETQRRSLNRHFSNVKDDQYEWLKSFIQQGDKRISTGETSKDIDDLNLASETPSECIKKMRMKINEIHNENK